MKKITEKFPRLALASASEAADVLKARFVDKSSALGVTLSNGQMSYSSPASLSVGSGKFPYALSASLSWRAGVVPTQVFGPTVASQPQSGWISTWNNNLTVSGSGMEAMGQTDVRAAVSTVAAFLAAQDVYKAAASSSREVAGVLTQSWWAKSISGNVVTVALGHSTQQFVKLADGTYMTPGAGPRSTLAWTGGRVPYEERCPNTTYVPQYYAVTRGWDYANASFAVTSSGGDVQQFGFWKVYHYDGMGYCGNMKGFRLNSWTFPQGVSLAFTYETGDYLNPIHRLKEVANSLGRKLRFNYDQYSGVLTGLDDGLAPTRTIAIAPQASGLIAHSAGHTDPAGAVTSFGYLGNVTASATQRPIPYARLEKVFTADNATKPNVQYTYDMLGRVKEVRDAVALQWENREPYQFFIADGTRGERVDPAGGSFVVSYDTDRRPSRYTDEIGRKTEVFYDGRGRTVRYVYPELDEELLEYDDRNNPIKLTKVAKPSCTTACTQMIEAAYHTTWNKPLWVKDQLGRQSDFTYYESGNGTSLIATALRPTALPPAHTQDRCRRRRPAPAAVRRHRDSGSVRSPIAALRCRLIRSRPNSTVSGGKNRRDPIHHAITLAEFCGFCHHAAITCDATRGRALRPGWDQSSNREGNAKEIDPSARSPAHTSRFRPRQPSDLPTISRSSAAKNASDHSGDLYPNCRQNESENVRRDSTTEEICIMSPHF